MIKYWQRLSRDMVESCHGRFCKHDWTRSWLTWFKSEVILRVGQCNLWRLIPTYLFDPNSSYGYHHLQKLEMVCSSSGMPNDSTRESCLQETVQQQQDAATLSEDQLGQSPSTHPLCCSIWRASNIFGVSVEHRGVCYAQGGTEPAQQFAQETWILSSWPVVTSFVQ